MDKRVPGAATDWLEEQEFFDLMQEYRHCNNPNQQYVIAAFEAVKDYVRSKISAAPAVGPSEEQNAEKRGQADSTTEGQSVKPAPAAPNPWRKNTGVHLIPVGVPVDIKWSNAGCVLEWRYHEPEKGGDANATGYNQSVDVGTGAAHPQNAAQSNAAGGAPCAPDVQPKGNAAQPKPAAPDAPTPETDAALDAYASDLLDGAFARHITSKLCDLERRLAAANEKLARLPADWESDSSLETWFPLTAERLVSLSKDIAAERAAREKVERRIAELELDAGHLWHALKDLSFDCDDVTRTCAPQRGTYNATFAVANRLAQKYQTAAHYQERRVAELEAAQAGREGK